MRVLLRTPPIPGVTGKRPDGSLEHGNAYFIAKAFDPREQLPRGYRPRPMSEWRRDGFTQFDGSMRIPAPAFFSMPPGVSIPDAVIPATSLTALSDDTLVSIEWRIVHGGNP